MTDEDRMDEIRQVMRELCAGDSAGVAIPRGTSVQSVDQDRRELADVRLETQELAVYLHSLGDAVGLLQKAGRDCGELLEELEAGAKNLIRLHIRTQALRVAVALAEPIVTRVDVVPVSGQMDTGSEKAWRIIK